MNGDKEDATGKYLGVILDDKWTFGDHIRYAMDKAEKSIATLGKLMPNVEELTGRTRRIQLNGVTNSVILYRAPVWYKACKIAKHRKKLISSQRK